MELDGEADWTVDDHVVQPSGRNHLIVTGSDGANVGVVRWSSSPSGKC